MPRFFTLTEAQGLLPQVERAMRAALHLYTAHQQAESNLQEALQRITTLGGSIPDRTGIGKLREHLDARTLELNDMIEQVHGLGCQIKDLRTGLVDFPTLYRGEEVLLCWRFGEAGIRFWHGLEEGFQGRKPIDEDFRENHRGDPLD